MHITSDISIGSIITIGATLIGVLITVGRFSQILTRLVEDVNALKEDVEELQKKAPLDTASLSSAVTTAAAIVATQMAQLLSSK